MLSLAQAVLLWNARTCRPLPSARCATVQNWLKSTFARPKLRFPRRVWRAIHLLSLPAFVMACVHGYEAGSDGTTAAFKILLVVLTLLLAPGKNNGFIYFAF